MTTDNNDNDNNEKKKWFPKLENDVPENWNPLLSEEKVKRWFPKIDRSKDSLFMYIIGLFDDIAVLLVIVAIIYLINVFFKG